MLFANLLACAGAALLLAIVPGPSTAVILRQTLRSGRRAALAATLANELGALMWALAAAVGLSALVAASQAAYDVLRLAGALVLIWLGAQSLWRSRRRVEARVGGSDGAVASGPAVKDAAQSASGTPGETWRSFRVGLVTTLANPKAAVFAASFLPQFVPPHAPVLATLLLLAVVWVLVDLCWYGALVWTVSRAHQRFTRSAVRRRLEQATGVVLIGLGARLAFESR